MSAEPQEFDDLPHVHAEPRRLLAGAIGEFDGRCAFCHPGAAGRCSHDAEYKTEIDWRGDIEPVALCPEHAGQEESA